MRERYLFRGKRKDNGEWVEGMLVDYYPDFAYIKAAVGATLKYFEVDPATVGQYTGKTDRNGVKMFEDDIIADFYERVVIKWGEYECAFIIGDGYDNLLTDVESECSEVIGNIHDNPEMATEERCL